jgi:hypothetical protein
MVEPIAIMLTTYEMAMAAKCGATRNICAMIKGCSNAYGLEEDYGWGKHIEGACGEIAVAKALGLFWSPTVNTFGSEPDIKPDIEVRTRSRHDYELTIRPKDDQARRFVLVTGVAPTFVVRGYCIGAHARRDEWLHDYGGRPPAWFVPQAELCDIRELMVR